MSWINKEFAVAKWVEVRSPDEILATLDEKGALENLPFMPEMLASCGRRYQVNKSAHKTCDTVSGSGGRRMYNTVHLDNLRCDGSAHGGCQANCLIFWKTGWLKVVSGPGPAAGGILSSPIDDSVLPVRAKILSNSTSPEGSDGEPVYSCQATRMLDYSTPLSRTRMSQYVADVRSRNVPIREAAKIMVLAGLYNLRTIGIGYRFSVRIYEIAHQLLRKRPAPIWRGRIAQGQPTPHERLDLRVGELVEVRSVDEILPTLNERGHNRGLSFDPEMTPYCGHQFRVARRVDRIINEKTGAIMRFSNPCIVLDGVICKSQYSRLRLMCPRQITSYWREIWLRRVPEN